MPRLLHLCAITSHIPVEIGDTIYPAHGGSGTVFSVGEGHDPEVKLKMAGGVLVSTASGFDLVWIDEAYTRPRPAGPGAVDHKPGTVIFIPAPSYLKEAADGSS